MGALASHQCDLDSIPGLCVLCGLSLLLVLVFAPRDFSLGTPVFPSPQKPTFPNSNSIWRVSPYCKAHLIISSWNYAPYKCLCNMNFCLHVYINKQRCRFGNTNILKLYLPTPEHSNPTNTYQFHMLDSQILTMNSLQTECGCKFN